VALEPLRLFDSRSASAPLNEATAGRQLRAGQVVRIKVAGERGVPADARIASVNLTATQTATETYLTIYDCGARPGTSNLNAVSTQYAVANAAIVELSADGDLCVYTHGPTHAIVDINGTWR
jgi:hypothetical protein